MSVKVYGDSVTEGFGSASLNLAQRSLIEVRGKGELIVTNGRGPAGPSASHFTTSTTETVALTTPVSAVVQTAEGITTSVSGEGAGTILILINNSTGRNEIGFQIDDDPSPYIMPNEGLQIYFDGSNWSLI